MTDIHGERICRQEKRRRAARNHVTTENLHIRILFTTLISTAPETLVSGLRPSCDSPSMRGSRLMVSIIGPTAALADTKAASGGASCAPGTTQTTRRKGWTKM